MDDNYEIVNALESRILFLEDKVDKILSILDALSSVFEAAEEYNIKLADSCQQNIDLANRIKLLINRFEEYVNKHTI